MAMDELEVSKIFGAGCAALLAFVGFGQLGSALVGVDQLDEPAYVIELPEGDSVAGGDAPAPMSTGEVMALANLDDGPKVFKKCTACHKAEKGAPNGVGPHLWGIVGRGIGAEAGFAYSNVLAEKGGVWDFAALNGFLEAPKKWAPGTKMGFVGLSKPEDRASVIAWLNEQSDSPLPIPAADVAEAPAEADTAEAEAPAETETVEAEAPADAETAEAEAPAEAETAEAEAPAEVETAEAEAPAEAETAEAEAPAEVETAEAEAPAEAETAEAEAPAEAEAAEVEAPAEVETAEAEAPAEAETAEAEAPAEAETAAAAAPAAVASAAAFMVGADAEKGAKVFRKCKACHKVDADAGNGVGPNLHAILGRDIASLEGFKYSDALLAKEGEWDFENMSAFLTKPKEWAKGTKMAFPGLRKEQDRADVIAYLNAQSDAPLPMPE